MEEIRKPIDFSQCHAGIDREAEAEILRMMDTHKDTVQQNLRKTNFS